MLRTISSSIFLLSLLSFSPTLRAEVRLPEVLGSHMVLQRAQPVHLWGWAAPGETVSAELKGATQNTTADRLGKWSLYLPPQPAGGPFAIKISGTNTIVLDDVLFGDVWFASGQSNMEMPLSGFPNSAVVNNSAEEIAKADLPNMRLLLVKHKTSDFPLRDFEDSAWARCTPETAAKFSAVAFFFGRTLLEKEHVPIGLIDSTWGGTPADAWISLPSLSADAALMPAFAEWAKFADAQSDLMQTVEAEKREDEAARKANQPLPQHPWHPNPSSWQPAALYNGMVAPAIGLRIKGVIWYQGESNAGAARANLYERVMPTLIADWRSQWQQGNFPFLFVQIANFKASQPGQPETWPILRETQRRTLSTVNSAMAVTIDIGDADNIHPANKQDVGGRLALAARALAYGENIEYSGPNYREASVENHSLRLWFDHLGGGLTAKGAGLTGFEIAGDDHHFMKADARIEDNTVVVSCDAVASPKYARYAWANVPPVSLYNKEGLPASPFTSEQAIPHP